MQSTFLFNNGKLTKEFNVLYDSLHIYGYYRGAIYNVHAVKDQMTSAKEFIEKLK